jgi:hypothetical protein
MTCLGPISEQTINVNMDVFEYKVLDELLKHAAKDPVLMGKVTDYMKAEGFEFDVSQTVALTTSMQLVTRVVADKIMGVKKFREEKAKHDMDCTVCRPSSDKRDTIN